MYFIEKGECIVKVKDKKKLRNAEKVVRYLYPSDYFGEIAMIYKERRSTSVSSNNYTSMGKIGVDKMGELFFKYPEVKALFLEKIKEYDDNLTLFFQRAVLSIEYLADANMDIQNDIIFSFIPEYFEKGSLVFK